MTLFAATLCAAAQEATLPTPDAKTLGMEIGRASCRERV